MPTFNPGDRVVANVNAQSLNRGQQYMVVEVLANQSTIELVTLLNTIETSPGRRVVAPAARRIRVNGAHLVLSAAPDWEVLRAEVTGNGDGLHISGINQCTTSAADREFRWNCGWHSFVPGNLHRFSFDRCAFGPGAREKLDALKALAVKLG